MPERGSISHVCEGALKPDETTTSRLLRPVFARARSLAARSRTRPYHILRELEHSAGCRIQPALGRTARMGQRRGRRGHEGSSRAVRMGSIGWTDRRRSSLGSTRAPCRFVGRSQAPSPCHRPRPPHGALPRMLPLAFRGNRACCRSARIRRHRHDAFRKPVPVHRDHSRRAFERRRTLRRKRGVSRLSSLLRRSHAQKPRGGHVSSKLLRLSFLSSRSGGRTIRRKAAREAARKPIAQRMRQNGRLLEAERTAKRAERLAYDEKASSKTSRPEGAAQEKDASPQLFARKSAPHEPLAKADCQTGTTPIIRCSEPRIDAYERREGNRTHEKLPISTAPASRS